MGTVEELRLYYNVVVIIFLLLGLIFKFDKSPSKVLVVLLIITLSIVVGSRGIESTVDTRNYWLSFERISLIGTFHEFSEHYSFLEEPLMYLVFFIASKVGSFNTALWLISILTLSLVYLFCERFCRISQVGNPYLLFIAYLLSFYIESQQYHIMRSGLAMAFVLNSYYYLLERQKKQFIIFALLAVMTHVTALIPILSAFVVKTFKISDRAYYIIFILAIVVSYLGFGFNNISFLSNIGVDKIQSYLAGSQSDRYSMGFRWSFVAFNTFFLLFFLYFKRYSSNTSVFFIHLYILLSTVLFLSFNIPFFDRIGAFSWNIIPFLSYYIIVRNHLANQKAYGFLTIIFLVIIKQTIGLIS